jgi:hypothetical protein
MAYLTRDDLLAYLSDPQITKMLDDNRDGLEDTGLLAQLIQTASLEVDGRLSTTFTTPFTDPAPPKVRAAAVIFVVEAMYARRQVPGTLNPFTERADYWRRTLDRIGLEGKGMDASVEKAFAPVGWVDTDSVFTDNSL